MTASAGWHVELEFSEVGNRTSAVGLLRLADGTELKGRGYAMRHPLDPEQVRVGEEIAGSRVLMDLASQLLQKAHTEIDEAAGHRTRPLTR